MIEKMKWKDAQEAIKESNVMYLFIGTDWCGDCVMMEPIVDELANHFINTKEVKFVKVDAEEAKLFRDPTSEYKVSKIPTHVFLKNGTIKSIMYEYTPLEVMIEEINKLI